MPMLVSVGLAFLLIVFLMVIEVPAAVAFGIGAIILLVVFNVDPVWAMYQALHLIANYTFLCFPLYILLGSIIGVTGMAGDLCNFASNLLGRIKGGVGVTIVFANGIFGAMSGSCSSALAGLGKAFIPELEREGYPVPHQVALMSSSAVLSSLIPPSGFMIVFGFLGRLSIAKCFLTGAVPGLILAVLLSLNHLLMVRNMPGIHLPPKLRLKERAKLVAKSSYYNSLILLIPVVVLGVIYTGLGTPTESAAVASIYTLLIAFFIYRRLTMGTLIKSLETVIKLSGAVAVLTFFFFMLSRVLIIERVSEELLALMMTVSTNKWALMGMLNVLMLIMGMIMDDFSTCIIASILFLPMAVSIGFDPYHFVAIAAVNLELGLVTPPVAPLIYLAAHLCGNPPLPTYIKPVFRFVLLAFLPTLLLTLFIPEISTFLPGLFTRGA